MVRPDSEDNGLTIFERAVNQERKSHGYSDEKTGREEAPNSVVAQICRRFPEFVHNLPVEINNERDVQNILNAVLRLHYDDVRREEATPSHAGRYSKIDFLLKDEKIGIEVKKTREGLTEGRLGEQLATDKERYQSHEDCRSLICFIYDPKRRLRNPKALSDLDENDENFSVNVIVSPLIENL